MLKREKSLIWGIEIKCLEEILPKIVEVLSNSENVDLIKSYRTSYFKVVLVIYTTAFSQLSDFTTRENMRSLLNDKIGFVPGFFVWDAKEENQFSIRNNLGRTCEVDIDRSDYFVDQLQLNNVFNMVGVKMKAKLLS